MTLARSIPLFALAAVAEIGAAWLIWQGVRQNHGIGAGICLVGVALIMYAPRAGALDA